MNEEPHGDLNKTFEELKKVDFGKVKEDLILKKTEKEIRDGTLIFRKPPKKYLEVLKNPDLLNIINREFDKKLVGEIEPRKVTFLIANMRNVENLNKGSDNLLINAKSGTGKDHLGEAIFDFLPKTEKMELNRTTPKVLSYTKNRTKNPEDSWKKMALRMEDVSNAVLTDDSFKVILTANPNKINYAKTMIKQNVTEIEIEGKPSIIMTLAKPDIKEEFLRRMPILFLDESTNQSKEIINRQAEYAEQGISLEYDETIKNSLIFLRRVKVKVPFAKKLVQIFDDSIKNVIVRTAFPRFLDYIKSSASLFQYQREMDSEGYILATKEDYSLGALCLKQTTNNLLMIPLSKIDKGIYDFFEEGKILNSSIDELLNQPKIQELSVSERWIRYRLDFLVSKGFLKRTTERKEGIFKPINVYSYNKIGSFDIPEFEELLKTGSNTTTASFTSNSSNSSNTNKLENNDSVSSNTISKETAKFPLKSDIIKKNDGVNEVFEVKEPCSSKHKKSDEKFEELKKQYQKEGLL